MSAKDRLEEAAKGWDELAASKLEWAAYLEGRGEYGGVHRNQAETYQKAAKALRLQIETGEPHCVCHLMTTCERAKAGVK